jgi:molecular chaperone DnaK (HSP70)
MVLGKMKETAEAYLGKKVTHAVVTVPACEFAFQSSVEYTCSHQL